MKKRDSGRGNRVGLSSLGFTTVLIVLLALLVFSILASITFGNADLSVKEVYSVVAYELFHIRKFSDFAEGAVHDVVWIIRFPRVILALCVGMGLAVCGVVMQAVVKNPLADPYVLGISSGASLGATIGVLFGFGALFGANSVGVPGSDGNVFSGSFYRKYRRKIQCGQADPGRNGCELRLLCDRKFCHLYCK